MKLTDYVKDKLHRCVTKKQPAFFDCKDGLKKYGNIDKWDDNNVVVIDFAGNEHIIDLENVVIFSDYVQKG